MYSLLSPYLFKIDTRKSSTNDKLTGETNKARNRKKSEKHTGGQIKQESKRLVFHTIKVELIRLHQPRMSQDSDQPVLCIVEVDIDMVFRRGLLDVTAYCPPKTSPP